MQVRRALCFCPVEAHALALHALLVFAYGVLGRLQVLLLELHLCLCIPVTLTCYGESLRHLQAFARLQCLDLATYLRMFLLQLFGPGCGLAAFVLCMR